MSGCWTYKSPNCFKCDESITDKDIYTVPAKINGFLFEEFHWVHKTEMNVTVCKKCYRDWKLKQIGINA